MTGSRTKNGSLLAVIFALVVTIGVPTLVNAQGRGHGRGQDKKADKFINGHDARDGRWDGRGPRRDRDDDDDFFDNDDRRDGRWRRRNRDRDDDDDFRVGRRNRRVINRNGVNNGYRAGYNAGLIDRANGERFNYSDERAYRNADGTFREGFRRGYEDGYRSGRSRGGILGGILGRRWR